MKTYMDKLQRRSEVPTSTPQQPKTTQGPVPQATSGVLRPKPVATSTPTHDDIAKRAYEIYLRNGCLEGQSEQNWKQAEAELKR